MYMKRKKKHTILCKMDSIWSFCLYFHISQLINVDIKPWLLNLEVCDTIEFIWRNLKVFESIETIW